MATPESIHRLLSVAASLLDHAATEIRDNKLKPVRRNVERAGKALSEVFEIQSEIYKLQPDLKPEHLAQPDEYSTANRLLTEYMYTASVFEIAGDRDRAIATFREFLALESSPLHEDIAAREIKRLQSAASV